MKNNKYEMYNEKNNSLVFSFIGPEGKDNDDYGYVTISDPHYRDDVKKSVRSKKKYFFARMYCPIEMARALGNFQGLKSLNKFKNRIGHFPGTDLQMMQYDFYVPMEEAIRLMREFNWQMEWETYREILREGMKLTYGFDPDSKKQPPDHILLKNA